MSDFYIYLFIRTDLSVPQQIVQTAHAIYEVGRELPQLPPGAALSPNAVLIGAESEEELRMLGDYLTKHEIKYHKFFEPDINAHTAIATYPISGDKRIPLNGFPTLK